MDSQATSLSSKTVSSSLDTQAITGGEGFALLYRTCAPRLFRYFWIHTGSQALAEDLVEETFLRALRSLASYSADRGAPTSWLYTLARRTLASQWSEQTAAGAEAASGLRPAESVLAGEGEASPEARIDLWQAVNELSGTERNIVALKFGAGLSHREIAAVTGLRKSHVGMVLHRALQRLRKRLASGEESDA